ncbi:alpha/beta hydrolase family protein [Rhizoctonia solani]|uniref:Alpha/beta hydrolase family protein n=1 Tax=Rhizoctonia solani TaxID=456999 RepID=A0A8H8P1H9_9AGAM|nr:alpha/beta hydrolase family protein [Rhizoctonia solani]QRW22650.1 alpha/beta hydrolase family protein [Rhizoctonia solani]
MSTPELHPLGHESKVAHLSTGHHYRYVDIHPPKGVTTIVTALLLHGFPDSAYGWRHQVKGWSARGIRLIIPDMLGYHGSSQPTDPEQYAMKRLSDELEELLPVPGLLCLPESTTVIDANVDRFVNLMYTSAKQVVTGECPSIEKTGVIEGWLKDETKSVTSELLSKEELNTMLSEIKAGVGFGAMLNYYRTRKINHELEKDLPQDIRPDIPKLMVIPSADVAVPTTMSVNAEKNLKNTEIVWIEGLCGHWVQLERPEESERIVGEWVERFSAKDWVP